MLSFRPSTANAVPRTRVPLRRRASCIGALVARLVVTVLAAMLVLMASPDARAQQAAQGFALERLYPSPAGAGWFVMDTLDFGTGLGGAAEWTTGYAKDRLRVTDGARHLAVVSDQAFTDFSFAATCDRFRLSFDVTAPLAVEGNTGTVGGYSFVGPSLDPSSNPDTLSDARFGLDARLFGAPRGPVRLGVSAQL